MSATSTRVSEESLYQVILAPHVSEKGARLGDKHRQFVFRVRCDAAKPVIKQAVEKMFSVQVQSVSVATVKGKAKQTGGREGRRSDWKKAYVTLKPGFDIDFLGAAK